MKDPQTIVGECDELSRHMDRVPSGMTKERYIEMKVQESLAETEAFDLLAMGRPEGPGCYCYVNNLLRDLIDRITKSYDFVVIDNAAGMEHISRRTAGHVGKLVLVSDYSVAGVRSAKRIYELAKELKIKIDGAYLIVNRVAGKLDALEEEIAATGLSLAGAVPYDEDIVRWSLADRPIVSCDSGAVREQMAAIVNKLTQ